MGFGMHIACTDQVKDAIPSPLTPTLELNTDLKDGFSPLGLQLLCAAYVYTDVCY